MKKQKKIIGSQKSLYLGIYQNKTFKYIFFALVFEKNKTLNQPGPIEDTKNINIKKPSQTIF